MEHRKSLAVIIASAAMLFASAAFAIPADEEPTPQPTPGGRATYTQCYEYAINADYYFREYLHWNARCISTGSDLDCGTARHAYDNWHYWWGQFFFGKCFGYPLKTPANPWEHDPDRPMSGNP